MTESNSYPPKAQPEDLGLTNEGAAAPCPQPVVATGSDATPEQLAEGVRMRDNPAEWAFVRLSKLIQEFESKLDKDEEIGARLVGVPGDGTMQVADIGFWGPDMILFFGRTSDGKPLRLVQHYTQLNLLLTATAKPADREAQRIGFQLGEIVGRTNPDEGPSGG